MATTSIHRCPTQGWRIADGSTAVVVALALLVAAAHGLPADGAGLAVRLAAASAFVLVVPGWLVVSALGRPAQLGIVMAAVLLWSLAIVGVGLLVTFVVGGSIAVGLGALGVVVLAALFLPQRTAHAAAAPDRAAGLCVVVAGSLLGAVVWWSTGTIGGSVGATNGDALFHLARVRKLSQGHALSLRALGEFRDGGLHPGYAFPLWHEAVALIARFAGVDPGPAFLYLPAILTPLVFVVAYGAGQALFRTWAGGVGTAIGAAAVLALSRGGVGALQFLAQPGAVARLLVVPALLALVFAHAADGDRRLLAATAVGSLVLTLVHPTYLLYVVLLVASFAGAALLLRSEDRQTPRRFGVAIASMLVPAGLVFAWLAPIVRQAAAFSPSGEETARALARYGNEVVLVGSSYALQPRFLAWGGAATVAALVAVPFAALASRRTWAAYVLGTTAVLGTIALTPLLFTRFADLMSLSQALRIGGFLPLAFALAGGAELLGALGAAAPLLALGAGTAAAAAYPTVTVGPAWVVWLAVGASVAALVVGAAGRLPTFRPAAADRWVVAAAVAFLLPVATVGLAHLTRLDRPDPFALTPGLVRSLDRHVRQREVVFSNVETSYRISAAAPVFVAASLPGHVARTPANRPYERQWDAVRFFFRPQVTDAARRAILRRYAAEWVVVDRRQHFTPFADRLQLVYGDARYRLYRVRPRG